MDRKDLTLVIMFAVINFVFAALIGQVPRLITNIPGIGYIFNIFYSITITVALLFYKGRRWRFLMQAILFGFLTLFLAATPVALIGKISLILNALVLDVVFNSFYNYFSKRNKLLWWVILGQVYYWFTDSFWLVLVNLMFYPWEGVIATWYIVMPFILPIMVIEAIAGGYIGYQIYQRVKKV
ncbi:MAG: hypothetical protein ACFFC6_16730 [Promethearchaeota archaeon]